MTATRVLAIFLAACAVAASALVAIPEESFEALASGTTGSPAAPPAEERPLVHRPAAKPEPADHHTGLPRLWLR
jgi:hypothetical protein